jgi:hypothetical protein
MHTAITRFGKASSKQTRQRHTFVFNLLLNYFNERFTVVDSFGKLEALEQLSRNLQARINKNEPTHQSEKEVAEYNGTDRKRRVFGKVVVRNGHLRF